MKNCFIAFFVCEKDNVGQINQDFIEINQNVADFKLDMKSDNIFFITLKNEEYTENDIAATIRNQLINNDKALVNGQIKWKLYVKKVNDLSEAL